MVSHEGQPSQSMNKLDVVVSTGTTFARVKRALCDESSCVT